LGNTSLKQQFDKDPAAVFLDVLRNAGEPLTAKRAKDTLVERGLPEASVSKQWGAFQREIVKFHPHVTRPSSLKYAWRETPVPADEALTRLLDLLKTTSRSKGRLRDELATLVHDGLKDAGGDDETKIRAAQERQAEIDVLRAFAELAGEVEELAYNSGDPDVIVERVQTRVAGHSLTQIGRSGDDAPFDPEVHKPIGSRPGDGATVRIVRPGYRNGTVLLQRALVTAR